MDRETRFLIPYVLLKFVLPKVARASSFHFLVAWLITSYTESRLSVREIMPWLAGERLLSRQAAITARGVQP